MSEMIEALRFCAAGEQPCAKCPYKGKPETGDCMTKIMLEAADELERLEKKYRERRTDYADE